MTTPGNGGGNDEGIAGPGGVVLDQYVLQELLSDSRRGAVYKAKHRLMGRTVAIKFLSAEAAASRQFTERFRRATKILGHLEHPNLVRAHEAGEQGTTHYLVMEYIDGQDLHYHLKADGPLPVGRAVNLVHQAAKGLAYAHEQGVFHRNIKPNKLLLDQQGVVKIVGFGLAHIDKEGALGDGDDAASLTVQGQVLGSYEYMAPEQAANSKNADQRSDIYSLGCTLHALLTGRPPYEGKGPTMQIVAHSTRPVPSLRKACPEVPEALDRVFAKMLAKKPEERFAAMSDVIGALEPFLPAAAHKPESATRSQGPQNAPTAPPVPPASAQNRLLVGIGGGAVVAVVLFLLIVFAMPNGEPKRATTPPAAKPAEIAKATLPVAPPAREKPEVRPRPKGPQTLENLLGPTPPTVPPASPVEKPPATKPPAETTLTTSTPTPPPAVPKPEPATPPQEPALQPKPDPAPIEPKEPTSTAEGRPAVPSEEARKRASQLMRDTFEAEMAAATTPDTKAQLGKRLLGTAAEINDDPAGRYVILEAAMGLAADAGDWPTGLNAIDSMARFFAIDAWPKKVDWLASCAESAKQMDQRRSAAAQAFELAQQADEAAQFEIAARLCTLAATEGKKAAPFPLMKQVRGLDAKVNMRLVAFQAYEQAMQKLATDGTNLVANLDAGRYECFVAGNWTAGLVKLAASGDADLQGLAAKELAAPRGPEQQIEVADGWRDLAEEESGLTAANLHRHAADWYEKAIPNATGLLKAKAERRLEESRAAADKAASDDR